MGKVNVFILNICCLAKLKLMFFLHKCLMMGKSDFSPSHLYEVFSCTQILATTDGHLLTPILAFPLCNKIKIRSHQRSTSKCLKNKYDIFFYYWRMMVSKQ